MIHKIKSLYDDGNGMGFKAIARELGISKNTVKKYLKASVVEIVEDRENPSRAKVLDYFRPYLASQLETFPKLSAVKLRRKLEKKVGPLNLSDRSFRRYVGQLKAVVATAQFRYYEPVIDTVPGAQIQVDPGELRGVMIDGKPRTVYFVVFVLSFSRYMFVAASLKPIDTALFMQMHDQAFRFFGGVPEECVYDQTKLVLIEEQYGELRLNDRFYQFATEANFCVRACKPADPESKGKNNHHYRDPGIRIAELEQQLTAQLEGDQGVRLAALLKASLPDQYRDQLVGAYKVLRAAGAIPTDWVDDILDRSHLTVLRLQEHIEARQIGLRNGRDADADTAPLADHERLENQSLVQYGNLAKGDRRGNA